LKWSYKWRDALETGQYYDLERKGFFENRPEELEPNISGLEFYMEAFRELSSCRPGGMDIQAIPFTAVAEYCRVFDIDDLEDFLFIIRSLDKEYLRIVADEAEKKKPKAGSSDATGKPEKSNRSPGKRGR
jgi:hypothetical protein